MPHIHLETTSDVVENQDLVDILERLVKKLSEYETVNPAAVKGYHSLRSTWLNGEGAPAGFIHCEVAVLTGRPPELLQSIADGMFAELVACFASSADSKEAGLTLEVREMTKELYRK